MEDSTLKITVMSIDAWRSPGGGWDWNDLARLGSFYAMFTWWDNLTPRELFKTLREEGYLRPQSRGNVKMEDEGDSNIVITSRSGKPLLLLEATEL